MRPGNTHHADDDDFSDEEFPDDEEGQSPDFRKVTLDSVETEPATFKVQPSHCMAWQELDSTSAYSTFSMDHPVRAFRDSPLAKSTR